MCIMAKRVRSRKTASRKRPRKKRGRGTRVLKVARKQTGKSDYARDRQRRALKPGLRRTSRGTTYYEARKNRSDERGRRR